MARFRRLIVTLIFILSVVAVRAGSAPAATSVSFAVGGDHGSNPGTAASLAKLDDSGVAFYLGIGDLRYGSESSVQNPTMWCDYMKSRLPTLGPDFPFQLLAGNHEDQIIDQFAACMPDKMGSTGQYAAQYYFDYPASAPLVRSIMISPALTVNNVAFSYAAGSTRYRWVESAIDEARAQNIPWIVVGMHKNCFTGASSSSCEVGADLMNMLVTKKVDLIFQGHEHTYKRGKQLALNGTTCKSVAGSYNVNCVVRDGATGKYTKGEGTIVLIIGTFGKGGSSSAGGYFVKGMTNGGDGFSKFTVTRDQIDSTFISSTSGFTDTFSIVPNQPPDIVSPGDQDSLEDQTVNLPITASDPEGRAVTYSATNLPAGLSINRTTGVISGRVATGAEALSPYQTEIVVTDNVPLTSVARIQWYVRDLSAPATPPSLTVTRTTTGIGLDWPSNNEVDLAGYDVYRSDQANGTFMKLNTSFLTESQYFDDAAPLGARAYYKVRAVDVNANISGPASGDAFRSKITFVGATTARGSGMTMVLAKPPGVASGDQLLAAFSVRGAGAIVPPKGWTFVSGVTHAPALNYQAVFRRAVSASDPDSYTFRIEGRSSAIGMIAAYRGAASRPAGARGQANPASTSITAPSVVSPYADSVQVGFFFTSIATPINPPAGMVERAEAELDSGRLRLAMALADGVVGAQTLTTKVASASTAGQNIGTVVVLAQAP